MPQWCTGVLKGATEHISDHTYPWCWLWSEVKQALNQEGNKILLFSQAILLTIGNVRQGKVANPHICWNFCLKNYKITNDELIIADYLSNDQLIDWSTRCFSSDQITISRNTALSEPSSKYRAQFIIKALYVETNSFKMLKNHLLLFYTTCRHTSTTK